MTILYRILSFIINISSVFVLIMLLIMLPLAIGAPALLLPVFMLACVVLYSWFSTRFRQQVLMKQLQVKKSHKDWVKVNGYVALFFSFLNISSSIAVIKKEMMKQFALLIILSSWGHSVFCQDTLTPLATRQKLKIGLYKNWDEFINNIPSIISPFVVEPYYSQMDTTKNASIQIFKYRFTDSTVRNKRVFGFFDGKEMFISIEFNDDLFKELRQKFYKVDRIGKFPFVTVSNKISAFVSTDLLRGAVGALVSAAKDNKVHLTNEIWYCNSKGRVLLATLQSIGYLLRNDKDFHNDFEKERKPGNAAFLKYLIKMNERYPY